MVTERTVLFQRENLLICTPKAPNNKDGSSTNSLYIYMTEISYKQLYWVLCLSCHALFTNLVKQSNSTFYLQTTKTNQVSFTASIN